MGNDYSRNILPGESTNTMLEERIGPGPALPTMPTYVPVPEMPQIYERAQLELYDPRSFPQAPETPIPAPTGGVWIYDDNGWRRE